MTDEAEKQTSAAIIHQVKITVDYKPGRWSKTFHIFDLDGREIALQQKDAIKLAQNILKIAKEK